MKQEPNESSAVPSETERRSVDRTSDDTHWESKVLARVGGHLKKLASDDQEHPALGWEATVLDTLRRRIESEPK